MECEMAVYEKIELREWRIVSDLLSNKLVGDYLCPGVCENMFARIHVCI